MHQLDSRPQAILRHLDCRACHGLQSKNVRIIILWELFIERLRLSRSSSWMRYQKFKPMRDSITVHFFSDREIFEVLHQGFEFPTNSHRPLKVFLINYGAMKLLLSGISVWKNFRQMPLLLFMKRVTSSNPLVKALKIFCSEKNLSVNI